MNKREKIVKSVKTEMGTYDVTFDPNYPEKGYTVTVRALPGIVTFGDSLKESMDNAREAIVLHCEGLLADGIGQVKPIKQLARA